MSLRLLCFLGFVVGALHLASTSHAWDTQKVLAAAAAYGERAVTNARGLQAAVADATPRDELGRLRGVNDFFNRQILFRNDLDLWGVVDHWASPLEMLQRGAGDCEDYAIGKYFTLTSMGVPHRKLRLVYVRAQLDGMIQPHMVLAFYPAPDADPWVLDSLLPELKRASERADLTPVFSFNAEGIWEGVGSVAVRGRPAERLSRWGDVMRKARQEGFQ